MNQEIFLLLAAESTHLVMKIEKILLDNNLVVRVIPLPTELKATCGLSVKCNMEDLEIIKKLLKENEVQVDFYKGFKIGFKKEFELLTF